MIVDAHEDLAWNHLLFKRNCMLSVKETRRLESNTSIPEWIGDTTVGYPEWVAGDVGLVFATLFLSPERHRLAAWEHLVYHHSEDAHQQYSRQLDYYHRLVEQHPNQLRLISSRSQLLEHMHDYATRPFDDFPVGLVILMEGADAIRSPSEVTEWYQRGVRIVGPAWAGTRYAGGTCEPGPLTVEGKDLLAEMDSLKMILDVSHMSDQGVFESIERYPHGVIASHANPRALLPASQYPERHLSDDAIRGISERGGVIGVALYNPFLKDGWTRSDSRGEVSLDRVAEAIDYVCQLVGDSLHVGFGSDFNGCFGLDSIPAGLDSIADLGLIGDRLHARGYSSEDVDAILGENWLHLLKQTLPEG